MVLPQNKHVHIFDFDETLCTGNGLVKVRELSSGRMFYLNAGEYSNWRETDIDPRLYDMDFSEFEGYPLKVKPVKGVMTTLKILLTSEEDTCVLVTGRDELSGPRAWLLSNGVDVDRMILMCSGDPNKRMCYESIINTLQPQQVTIYEDVFHYIKQCEEVCAKYEVFFTFKHIVA